jgi:steroid delta-isomerase-like uncharacterized protein
MLDRNKEIIRTLAEVVQRGDLDRVAELFAPDYAPHDPSNPLRRGGVEGAREFIAMLHAGLSDVRYAIGGLTAEDDRVVYRFTLQGIHTGVFMGIPPSGRTIRVTGMDMFRLVNGKIVESWASADALGMLQQLGALPPLGPSPGSLVASPPSSGRRSVPPVSAAPVSNPPVSAIPPTMRS